MTSTTNLHRFLLFTAVCTFLLIVAGGLVTSTQSGLSVPDWPNTYGHFMFAYPVDQMVGGIFYEHSHRMIASVVGFLTVIAAFWIWKREERRWVRNLGFAALGLVIAQGVLGGLTVLYLLPTPISVSHATMAQTFFCVMASLALLTSDWWRNRTAPVRAEGNQWLIRLSVATTLAVYIQLILGALMRHTEAGLAVPDFPLAYGQIFPSLSPESLARYNQQLIDMNLRLAADGPITATQIVIHMLHRIWAIAVLIGVLSTGISLIRRRAMERRFGVLGILLLALLVVQTTLGALTVLSAKAVPIATAHVAAGAALLATALLASLHAIRALGLGPVPRSAPAFSIREAHA